MNQSNPAGRYTLAGSLPVDSQRSDHRGLGSTGPQAQGSQGQLDGNVKVRFRGFFVYHFADFSFRILSILI